MKNTTEDVRRLEREFTSCQEVLAAIGDETRQYLLCVMLQGSCDGSRIVEIADRMKLSRPALSRHMQILKKAKIVKSRREGAYVYYYLDPEAAEIRRLVTLFRDIDEFMKNVPDRSGEHD